MFSGQKLKSDIHNTLSSLSPLELNFAVWNKEMLLIIKTDSSVQKAVTDVIKLQFLEFCIPLKGYELIHIAHSKPW
jgi:hypothetical protein